MHEISEITGLKHVSCTLWYTMQRNRRQIEGVNLLCDKVVAYNFENNMVEFDRFLYAVELGELNEILYAS